MTDVKIRMANNDDAKEIEALVQEAGLWIEGLDWSRVAPYWLVAELSGEVVGCLQISLGLPVGVLEMLAVDDGLSKRDRAAAVMGMMRSGMETHAQNGAQAVIAHIQDDSFIQVLEHRGAAKVASGHLMALRT